MNQQKLIGLNFDGVVVRRTKFSVVHDMTEVTGCRKTIRQMTHRGYEVVFVTIREGEALKAAEHFLAVTQLPARLVGLGRDCQNGLRLSVTSFLVYASDKATDLLAMKGVVPYLYLFSPLADDVPRISHVARRVGSHHELLTELSKSLPHK